LPGTDRNRYCVSGVFRIQDDSRGTSLTLDCGIPLAEKIGAPLNPDTVAC